MKKDEAIRRLGIIENLFKEYQLQNLIKTCYHHETGSEFFNCPDVENLSRQLDLAKNKSGNTIDKQTLDKKIKNKAIEISDGHYSIFSFTTNYRGLYGTYHSHYDFRDYLSVSPAFSTIEDLYENMLNNWQQHIVGDAPLQNKRNPDIQKIVEDHSQN